MPNDSANVSVSKPKAGGAVFAAPKGTAIPANASTALPEAFKCLGYISDDGVTQTVETDSEEFKDWGGDVIEIAQTSYSEKFKMTFVENNIDVMKQVYGEKNVTGSWESGITVKHTSDERAEYVYVIETVMKGNRVSRLVIPRGKIVEIGDISRKRDSIFGYESTINALPYDGNATSVEYFATVASA